MHKSYVCDLSIAETQETKLREPSDVDQASVSNTRTITMYLGRSSRLVVTQQLSQLFKGDRPPAVGMSVHHRAAEFLQLSHGDGLLTHFVHRREQSGAYQNQ